MTITNRENGEAVLAGHVADQAALHGLLAKTCDLRLTLVAVEVRTGERIREL